MSNKDKDVNTAIKIQTETLGSGIAFGLRNYSSVLADSERNDCSVRALANAFGVEYDMAHAGAKMLFNRKDKGGAMSFYVEQLDGINLWGKRSERMGSLVEDQEWRGKLLGKMYHVGQGKKKFRTMSTGTFFKTYTEGRYILVVSGHMFAYVDGKVMGNFSDAQMLKRQIHMAFELG